MRVLVEAINRGIASGGGACGVTFPSQFFMFGRQIFNWYKSVGKIVSLSVKLLI